MFSRTLFAAIALCLALILTACQPLVDDRLLVDVKSGELASSSLAIEVGTSSDGANTDSPTTTPEPTPTAVDEVIQQELDADRNRAAELTRMGLDALERGDAETGEDYLEQALPIFVELDDLSGQADIHRALGLVACFRLDDAICEAHWMEALMLYGGLGDFSALENVLAAMTLLFEMDRTSLSLEEVLQEIPNFTVDAETSLEQAKLLDSAGNLALTMAEHDLAVHYYEQAATAYDMLNSLEDLSGPLSNLGLIAWRENDLETSRKYYQQALDVDIESGSIANQAMDFFNLGLVDAKLGDIQTAKENFVQALSLFESEGDLYSQVEVLKNLAAVAGSQDDYRAQQVYGEQALKIDIELDIQRGDYLSQAEHLAMLGFLAVQRGDSATAKDYLEQSVSIFQQRGFDVPVDIQDLLDSLP